MNKKIAIVLFNLGGPDDQKTVRPFLKNLFADPAILTVPLPIRWMLARLISTTRAASAKKNYAYMGGGSPLLAETEKQATALVAALNARVEDVEYKTFVAMRYWHPFVADVAKDVAAWDADEIIALPLYPQFSTTTTGSSLKEWRKHFSKPVKTICCYPFEEKLIDAHVDLIMQTYEKSGVKDNVVMLLSAHGLPEKIIKDGDPYQFQIEAMGAAIKAKLPAQWDIRVCYQSRVGPLKWIGPDTEGEIEHAAEAGKNIMISPIAFVSEHIETLVELGIEYREIADEKGADSFHVVPALGTHPKFIGLLADLIEGETFFDARPSTGKRLCPAEFGKCPCRAQNPLAS